MNLLRPEFTAALVELDTPIVGAYASRSHSDALVRRLLAEPDERLGALHGLFGGIGIVLLAEADALPWIDGLVYLRACSGDATVWVPSTTRISLPEGLFARALRRAHPSMQGTVLALPAPRRLIPLAEARPLKRVDLETWRAS